MFELTGTMNYTAPVMLCVLVAKTVADALEPKGIYDSVIECVEFLCSLELDCDAHYLYRLSQLPYLDSKVCHLHTPLLDPFGSHEISTNICGGRDLSPI